MLLQVAAAQAREEAVDIMLQRGHTALVLMSCEGQSQTGDFKKRTMSDTCIYIYNYIYIYIYIYYVSTS